MKEQHLDEAIGIRTEINYLAACKTQVENGLWTICQIATSEGEQHQYAATALNASEDLMRAVAKKALLADISTQIVTRRQRLKAIGVELEGEQATNQLTAPEQIKEAA